jgi:predicted nucleic acid-binding protein
VKVLVDSCAWSLLLRRKSGTTLTGPEQFTVTSLTETIRDGRVAIIGPIRQEVLSGIRDQRQFDKLRVALELFPDEQLVAADYEEAARLFNLCRSHGVECGSTDILLCAVAARNNYEILSNDQALKRCIEVLKSEGLLQ